MSSRSRAAANLAWHLADKIGIPVQVDWDNPSGRPGHGAWLVAWTDGPTVATMRGHAEDLVRYCRPLTIDMLRFSRFTTRHAWTAAMLALANRGELPQRPADAVAAAEHEVCDTDTAAWDHLWSHAGQLIEQTDQGLYQVVALVHATVTKPRNETICAACGRAFTPSDAGRPARHCSPTCRTRAWRRTKGPSR